MKLFEIIHESIANRESKCGKCYHDIHVGDEIRFTSVNGNWVPIHNTIVDCGVAKRNSAKDSEIESLKNRARIAERKKQLELLIGEYNQTFGKDWHDDYQEYIDDCGEDDTTMEKIKWLNMKLKK